MIDRLLKIKRAQHRIKKFGKAPHKPILLLSLIEEINSSRINQNKIYITPELISTFQSIWSILVEGEGWSPRFFLPFYHLKNDGFWFLRLNHNGVLKLTNSYSPKSISGLTESIDYGYFDDAIWMLLANSVKRNRIKHLLLGTFFPDQQIDIAFLERHMDDCLHQLTLDFIGNQAAEPKSEYYSMIKHEARSSMFKREVPKMYKYSCAISGIRVTASNSAQLVDACHINPISNSKNDTVQNGIALTPSLHRAFDRHLISIDENYRVLVSDAFMEDLNSPYNISQFKGSKVLLPDSHICYPSQENLKWHRSKLLV